MKSLFNGNIDYFKLTVTVGVKILIAIPSNWSHIAEKEINWTLLIALALAS